MGKLREILAKKYVKCGAVSLGVLLCMSTSASAALLEYDATTGLTWDFTTVITAIMALMVGVIGAAITPFLAQKGFGIIKKIFGKA